MKEKAKSKVKDTGINFPYLPLIIINAIENQE